MKRPKPKAREAGKSEAPVDIALLSLYDISEPPAVQRKSNYWSKFEGVLKHQLVLLLVTSVLLPLIVYFFNQHRTLVESRQKKAVEIVEKNTVFEGQLYSLYLDIRDFHANNVLNPPKDAVELKDRKNKFVQGWDTRFIELNKAYPENNIWVTQLYNQGAILQLFSFEDIKKLRSPDKQGGLTSYFASPPANLLRLKDDIDNYQSNVNRSMIVVSDLRSLLDSPTYDFKRGGATDTQMAGDITAKYNKLRDERRGWVSNLVEDFTP